MKEIVFLHTNKSEWESIESFIDGKTYLNPDELKSVYMNLFDCLSYSRTYYPHSKTTQYLNELAFKVHSKLYSKKKFDFSDIKKFWKIELPLAVYEIRKELLISLIVFVIGALIGIISTQFDDSFVRVILGDDYVNMTMKNIKNNDPMAVYKSQSEINMFASITFNNIIVSFNAFALGLLTAMGSCLVLFKNGIMLGSFQQFFYKNNMFWQSFRTIWIHGTLEISAIVIAGGTGIALGNSFLFPKTYSRAVAFQNQSKKAVKVLLGLVPIFITAGFLESFVTRLTEMPDFFNILIIVTSFSFIIWYFVIYPQKVFNRRSYVKVERD